MSTTVYIALAAVTAIVIAGVVWLKTRGLRPTPPQLEPGSPLPDFEAVHEDGEPVRSSQLRGSPAVILFVRGNWCPFCSAQVKKLTQYYRDITDLGASLILVTPKPLETTRRVAEFFEVDFDFLAFSSGGPLVEPPPPPASEFSVVTFDEDLHWTAVYGYETPHNAPNVVLKQKQAVDDGLFFVALAPGNQGT